MAMDIGWLLSLSDADLLAYAGQAGIDTSPFTMGAFPSDTNTQFGAPIADPGAVFRGGQQAPLPFLTSQRGIPNIATNVNLPGISMTPGLGVGLPNVDISPEARTLVSQMFGPMRQRGNEELMRFATTAAGRRGLNLTDTPIFDPLLRSKAQLELELGGQEATSLLNMSQNMRDFLQRQALEREQATQQRFGLGLQAAVSGEQISSDRLRLLEAAQQARDRGDETRAQLLEQAAQFRMQLGQRAGEFGGTMGLNQAQFLEEANQRRFALGEQQRQFNQSFFENMRQFQTDQGRLGDQSQRSFLQNIFGIQENLAQQAFANRLQLAQASGQFASNLSGQRLGFGTGQTTVNPPNLQAGFGGLGLGLEGLFGSPQPNWTWNPTTGKFDQGQTSGGVFPSFTLGR